MTAVGPDGEQPTGAVPAADHPATDSESTTMNATPEAGPAHADRAAGLTRELVRMSLRMDVTWLVARDMSSLVNHDDECVDLVVEDVLRCWQDTGPGQQRAQSGGLDGFWNRYADRVEFAAPESGDQYRAEFCPPEPESFDMDAYYAAVWRAHATGLRLKTKAPVRGA